MIGCAAIRDFFGGMMSAGRIKLTLQDQLVQESGDLAYLVGAFMMTIQPATGEAVQDTGKYVEVWRRQADGAGWCMADMFNSDLAAS